MDLAINYRQWILDVFRPFIGGHVVEVGAGTGSFSEALLQTNPHSLTMLEPSANMYPLLQERLKAVDKNSVGSARQSTLIAEAPHIPVAPDTIIYVNVLEHVEDDERELAAAHSLLATGGRILIFVPAHRWLMANLDRQLGHYRRYTMTELTSKCKAAGFEVRVSSYFDVFGIVPWWVKFTLFGSTRIEPQAVRFYDRWIVPISKFVERVIPAPIGKNLILIAEKSSQRG
jgi:SAM-dependent methyltransferase